MIAKPERQRFDTSHPNLCTWLRWKSLFIDAESDPTVPRSNDGLFWCMHTQTCIGPDGKLAEPGDCHDPDRKCHSNTGL
jgi:hypothetical protein